MTYRIPVTGYRIPPPTFAMTFTVTLITMHVAFFTIIFTVAEISYGGQALLIPHSSLLTLTPHPLPLTPYPSPLTPCALRSVFCAFLGGSVCSGIFILKYRTLQTRVIIISSVCCELLSVRIFDIPDTTCLLFLTFTFPL